MYKDLNQRKEYHKQYIRQHYLNNKQYYLDKARVNDKLRREEVYSFLNRFKSRYGCQHCGIKDPRVLDFHHLKDKIKAIATIARAWSLSRVKEEVRKCILLCANCHRIEHYEKRRAPEDALSS